MGLSITNVGNVGNVVNVVFFTFYLSLDVFFQYVIIILHREREKSQGPRKWPSFICFFGVAFFKMMIRLVSVDKCLQVNTLVNACQCV